MKKIQITAGICFFAVLALAASCFAGEMFRAKVIGITDGDTIRVLASGNRQIKIRLYGIDCPESRQAFGNRARQAASDLAYGKEVEIEEMQTDRYGRTVAIVNLPNGSIMNAELVKLGMAWVYPQYCKAAICREWEKMEARARKSGTGLWSDKNPSPPWEWRKLRRK